MNEEAELIYSPEGNKQITEFHKPVAKKIFNGKEIPLYAAVRILIGPLGSGKSTACVNELIAQITSKPPSIDGVRRTKVLVVRNTYGQLKETAFKEFVKWGRGLIVKEVNTAPFRILIRARDGEDKIESELVFIALDDEASLKSLESTQFSFAWINEARHVSAAVFRHLRTRLARYPSPAEAPEDLRKLLQSDDEKTKDLGWALWLPFRGVIADTNPALEGHWLRENHEKNLWVPKGMNIEDMPLIERHYFFKQAGGLSEDAENVKNLSPDYYKSMLSSHDENWIQMHVHGEYTYESLGDGVYRGSWNRTLSVVEDNSLKPDPLETLYIGLDFGLTPACTFGQMIDGVWYIYKEIVIDGQISNQDFSQTIQNEIRKSFKGCNDIVAYGDPTGWNKSATDMKAYASIFINDGLTLYPSPCKNVVQTRVNAVSKVLRESMYNKSRFRINANCVTLIEGFNGYYKYRKDSYSYTSFNKMGRIEKNQHSHVHDALQYLICGGGRIFNTPQSVKSNTGKITMGVNHVNKNLTSQEFSPDTEDYGVTIFNKIKRQLNAQTAEELRVNIIDYNKR